MAKYEYDIIGSEYSDTKDVPKDKNIYYRCGKCGESVPSLPKEKIVSCNCRNIHIDLYYWRLAVDDLAKFEVLKKRRIGRQGVKP